MANPKSLRELRRQPPDDDSSDLYNTDAPFATNAHSAESYMKPGRLPVRDCYGPLPNGDYGPYTESPPLHDRVRQQVFSSIGERAGTMSFASQLDRSRGVGTLGATGGVQERGSGSKGEKPLDRGGNLAGSPPRATRGGY